MTREKARFADAMTAVARVLPFGLSRYVGPSEVGFLLISFGTFLLNLVLLALFHGVLRAGLSLAIALAFGLAAVVNYVLNRVFNFRSHGAAGRQFALFAAIEVSNFFLLVLGLTDLLVALGVYYELARVISACCEGVYLYCGMRWLVFRDPQGEPGARPAGTPVAVEVPVIRADVLEGQPTDAGSGA
ncbi:MAG: GtrA family protein [Streptosporangiales bacterium]|nr:GtrA family protein [Streptosporangiales bacterium]